MVVTENMNNLNTLIESLQSATSVIAQNDEKSFFPPADGISLLDVKNDLLLSYLHNLVLLAVIKLRSLLADGAADATSTKLVEGVVRKLVELRVYLERGIRPLEGRLRYQIQKVIKASEEAERISHKQQHHSTKSSRGRDRETESPTGEESDSDPSPSSPKPTVDELSYRPNLASLTATAGAARTTTQPHKSNNQDIPSTRPYRPPKVTPTAMPPTGREREAHRSRPHRLIDEFVDAELSSAPLAQPSVGSGGTILARGRAGMTARDRDRERERVEYEERNFVRLPAESRAERRRQKRVGGQGGRDVFGGEDWTGLGGLGDRVVRSVGTKRSGGESVVERREKRQRRRATEDGPRGDGGGPGLGDTFEKRRKILQARADRKKK